MTPRCYWDQGMYLWEEDPCDASMIRSVWSHARQRDLDGPYFPRSAIEHAGCVLIPVA